LKHTYLVALSSAVLLAGVSVSPAYATTPEPGDCTSGSLTVIGTEVDDSFGCSGVAVIANSITVIRDSAFEGKSEIHTVVFQDGSVLTTIRFNAFAESGLTSITIPASVQTIEAFAFAGLTSLTSVTFEAGSSLTTLGVKAFAENPALTSVTFRGMTAPTSVAADAFSLYEPQPNLYLEDGATGFGSVGDTWNGLKIAAGGTIVIRIRIQLPIQLLLSSSTWCWICSFIYPPPPPPASPEVTSRSLVLDTAVLAKQQKKVLRTLIKQVGAGGSFEVVAGIARQEGFNQSKALRALARDNARAIKKYLVKRGVKKRDVRIKVKVYKRGANSISAVLGSKPNSS
jgi:hypothetical protein